MAAAVIWWSKSYHEDLGTQDEQGFYDYAYQYFCYEFQLADGGRIVIRCYTDEPGRGSLFLYDGAQRCNAETFLLQQRQFVAAVVSFMQTSECVTSFDYFSGAYHPLPLSLYELPLGEAEFTLKPVNT